jgi:hypothetical protein
MSLVTAVRCDACGYLVDPEGSALRVVELSCGHHFCLSHIDKQDKYAVRRSERGEILCPRHCGVAYIRATL